MSQNTSITLEAIPLLKAIAVEVSPKPLLKAIAVKVIPKRLLKAIAVQVPHKHIEKEKKTLSVVVTYRLTAKRVFFQETTNTSVNSSNVSVMKNIVHEEANQVYINMAEVIQTILTIIVIMSLLMFILSKRNLRRKTSQILYGNLLTTHLLFHVAILVSNFVSYSRMQVIFNCGFLIAMFIGLIMLTVERVVMIKMPFTNPDVELKYIIPVIVSGWLPTIIFLITSFLVDMPQFVLSIISTVLITVAIIFLSLSNITVYIIAKKHDKFLKENTSRKFNNDKHNTKILKASYVCFSIVFSFVLLWMPFVVHNIMSFVGVYEPSNEKIFTKVVEHIALLNSLVDAVLFVCLSREANQELKKVLRNTCQRKSMENKKRHLLEMSRLTDGATTSES